MRERIISGLVIALLVVLFGIAGGPALGAAMMLCALIGYHELVTVTGAVKGSRDIREIGKFRPELLETAGLCMTVIYYAGLMVLSHRRGDVLTIMQAQDRYTLGILICTFFVFMLVYVLTFPRYHGEQIMSSLFAFLYVPVLLSFVYRARILPYGLFIYALIFVSSSICDVCALAAGMAFGRHKMAPELSPKKTVEGAIGGVAGAAATAFLVALAVHAVDPDADVRVAFTVIGACAAVFGMTGDLAASAIKRNHGIKDYSNLIPGHGGILDRFDSIIFTAPVIWLLGALLILPGIG